MPMRLLQLGLYTQELVLKFILTFFALIQWKTEITIELQ